AGPGRVIEVAEKRGAATLQVLEQPLVDLAVRPLIRFANQPRRIRPEIKRNPSVGTAERSAPGPDHVAHRDQLIEQLRPVVTHSRRQDIPLQYGRWDRASLKLENNLGQPIQSTRLDAHGVPRGKETAKG